MSPVRDLDLSVMRRSTNIAGGKGLGEEDLE